MAICKELGKTSVIVLAGRNLAKMEAAKVELDELGVERHLCKTDIADRAGAGVGGVRRFPR